MNNKIDHHFPSVYSVAYFLRASQVALLVKNPPANAGDVGDMGSIPGWEDPLEKGMATHSSILAWRIPWRIHRGAWQATVHGVTKNRT